MIPIYRKRTTIDSSGRETASQTRYYVVDSTEALSKFGQDAWDRVVCVMTTGQAWQFKPYKWNDPKVLFHHGMSVLPLCAVQNIYSCLVKGIYLSLTSDPPNPKIKDWNVTELKVSLFVTFIDIVHLTYPWYIDRRQPTTRRQIRRRTVLENVGCLDFS